ncbi:unnamed protein product [Adineta steineri]|uniref:Uncharacterized protein n=1 Tax=Adineta steineri TaxID=433720 RepID=A0A815AP52_9BILA|nr:unnamed protein product [Adineta steineri]CAF1345748.1 unnamed protein product [Adineta steineri]
MSKARRYWSNLVNGYDWNRIQHLVPHENKNDQIRSGRAYSTAFISSVTAKNNLEVGAVEENSIPIIYFDRDRSHDNAQLYSQKLALEYCLINNLIDKIEPNEIICQCVEQSFEMIIGMLAILISGAVYSSLSPLDSPERLKTLIHIDALRTTDRAIQLSSCTWDIHIHEVVGTPLVGGTVILLRSEQGNRNMDYLSQIIEIHQATYVCIVPTLQVLLFDIVEAQKAYFRLNTLRLIWSVGEPISCRFIARILSMLPIGCQYIDFSGATEGTVIQMFHVVTKDDELSESGTVPSGQPMPYFRCHILDQFLQIIPIGYIGELFVSGPIMNGYLNRPDLNSKALVQLPDEPDKSYRTGDLARLIPSTGKIQLLGRNDFQVKVNGQRVELEEIQAVIYQSNSSISNCAVVKVVERGRDHLIPYKQLNKTSTSVPFDEKLIRINCPDHLPFKSNGKLDKAALTKANPSSLLLPLNNDETSNDHEKQILMTNQQQLVHDLWCDVLQFDIKIDRLRQAIDAIIAKHAIFRTSLDWNINTNVLAQYIHQFNYRNQYEFVISYAENDEETTKIINKEITNEEIYLEKNDIIIFNLHHIAFDGASRRIFFSDLKYNLENDSTLLNNENQFQYIDYSVYEKQMDIISSYHFWQSHLDGLNLKRRIMLPFDRHRLLTDQHSGFAHLIDIPFDIDLIHSFLDYASSQDITPFQLGLTIFYTFLYKLSQNQNDLCISCIHANRYRTELQNLIGMFVATLPHRIQIHPAYSFNHLIKQVQNEFYSIFEHTHYPLLQILQDLDYKHSSAAFLNILFDFITYSSDTDLLSINQAQFQPVPLKQKQNVIKFDMKLLFFHDPTVKNQTISCSLICSEDVYDIETVEELSKQFQHLLSQLFVKHSSSTTKTTSFDLVN